MPRVLRCHLLRSVTLDRDDEFADHAQVTAEVGMEFYFALLHHPWQRGTSENTNGLLREHFPKGEPLGSVSEKRMQKVYGRFNRRPHKLLGCRMSYEVYRSEVLLFISNTKMHFGRKTADCRKRYTLEKRIILDEMHQRVAVST